MFIMRSAALAAAMAIGLSSGPVQAQEIGRTLDEVIALAKLEPPLRLGSAWLPEITAEISAQFEEKYGLRLAEVDYMIGIDTRERILNEAIAGIVNHDLLNVSAELREQYVEAGVVQEVPWRDLFPDIDPVQISPDGNFVATGFSRYGILYNADMVAEADVPRTWEDCLDPKWSGRFAVYSRPRSFTALWTEWGPEKTIAYVEGLQANNAIFTASTEVVQQIASGEVAMGCGFQYHAYLRIVDRDPTSPIRFVSPTELPFHVSEALTVMKGARSPNAAILLTGLAVTDAQDSYRLIGRTSPFVEGSEAWQATQDVGGKVVWVGWDFDENAATEAIVSAWGFTR